MARAATVTRSGFNLNVLVKFRVRLKLVRGACLRRPTSGCRLGPPSRRPPGQLARLFKLKRGAGELGDSAARAGSERRRLFTRAGSDFGACSGLGLVRASLRAPQLGLRLISLRASRAAEARWPARAGPGPVANNPGARSESPVARTCCEVTQLQVPLHAPDVNLKWCNRLGDSEPDPRLGRVREQDFEEAPSHRSAQRHRFAARCAAGPLFTD
jgi:hypothetical protein